MKKNQTLVFFILLCCSSSLFSQKQIENWKTYRNDLCHFCIDYPSYCTNIDTSAQLSDNLKKLYQSGGTLSFWEDHMAFTVNFGNEVIPIFSVAIFNNPENIDLKTFSKNVVRYYKDLYQDNDLIIQDFGTRNFNGIKVTYKNKVGGYDGIRNDVFIEKDNRIFAIMILNPPEKEIDTLFKKLPDSFRFTD